MRRLIFHPGSATIALMEIDPVNKQMRMGMIPNTQAARDGFSIPNGTPPTVFDDGPIGDHVVGGMDVRMQGYAHVQRPDPNEIHTTPPKRTVDNFKKEPVSDQDIKAVKKNLRKAKNFDKLLRNSK